MSLLRQCLGLLALGALLGGHHVTASAQDASAPLYVVSYVEVAGGTRNEGAALVRQYGEALRAEKDNLEVRVLQRRDRPEQFVLIDAWKSKAAFDAARSAAGQLGDKLRDKLAAPVDERLHTGLSITPAAALDTADTFYVVTHVDVVPPRKDDGVAMLQQLSAASRKQDGNLRFDVLQQSARPNHFTVVEAWKDRAAFDAHTRAAATREFRDKVQPAIGALYDDRFFRALD